MTFKLPEPDRMVESIDRDVFGSACGITKHWSYSEGQLKQAMRDVLEAAAKLCADKSPAEHATGKVDHNEIAWVDSCAIDIRAMIKEIPQ